MNEKDINVKKEDVWRSVEVGWRDLKIMDKGGGAGDWVNFGGFFLILVIIAGGIVGGYLAFFSNDYNIKEIEAGSLLDFVIDCFEKNGPFKTEAEIIENCGVNENVVDQRLIYFKNLNTGDEVAFGVRDYITQCGLVDRFDKFAKCEEAELGKDGVRYQIVVGSNADSRRVIR